MSNPKDQGPQAQAAALFGTGIQYVPGLGYVGPQAPNALGKLGDADAVMMINGIGSADDQRQVAIDPATGGVQAVTGAGFTLKAALTQPVTILGVTLPMWAWVLVAGGVLSIGAYYMLFHKKK